MSETPGIGLPGHQTTLFGHALRLHRLSPDKPLPREGEPYPDEERRRRGPRPKAPRDRKLVGVDVARILDEHFADPDAVPSALNDRFHDVYVPIHHIEHIVTAADMAGEVRAREAGRWLVRHATDRSAVTVGLALLAAVGTVDDIPLIQIIGLLSCHFGPLAARGLERLPGGADALMWLAERVTGWGRVYIVEALCRLVDGDPVVRPWLSRRAADGDFLNGYFVGRVARVAELHKAVEMFGDDAELVDHTTRLLHAMTYGEGMGTSLRRYPYAVLVLEAHVRALGDLEPTVERYLAAATIAQYLTNETPIGSDDPGSRAGWERGRAAYLALLDKEDWCATAREGLAAEDGRITWLADYVAPGLKLRAFPARQAES
ncbi:hypothetical protein OG252_15390 [Streptomyces sp. NBC_01352]|uniref:hypothetical protein n=1 Tax=unclassified Streptomyces TaxID=2593676 RepID=UPI00225222EB|nr:MULTISPECIES: hypothetical protein [unclassified Streptomyces]MCX4697440.1 hypothetical protein [Streptomyces sp. NBC_01373]